jgi:hypothetical protein
MTIAGMVLIGRRVGANATFTLAVAALWSWWSGALYVVWQGFPEPILIGFMTLGTAVLAGPRPQRVLGGVLLGLSVATKQFALGVLPLLVRSPKGRIALATAVLTVAVVIVPFVLLDPTRFIEGSILAHIGEPGRAYALNLLNWPGCSSTRRSSSCSRSRSSQVGSLPAPNRTRTWPGLPDRLGCCSWRSCSTASRSSTTTPSRWLSCCSS